MARKDTPELLLGERGIARCPVLALAAFEIAGVLARGLGVVLVRAAGRRMHIVGSGVRDAPLRFSAYHDCLPILWSTGEANTGSITAAIVFAPAQETLDFREPIR